MCREGGCGICVVSVKSRNPNGKGDGIIRGVNSVMLERFMNFPGPSNYIDLNSFSAWFQYWHATDGKSQQLRIWVITRMVYIQFNKNLSNFMEHNVVIALLAGS